MLEDGNLWKNVCCLEINHQSVSSLYSITRRFAVVSATGDEAGEQRMALINQKSPSADFHGDFPSTFTTTRGPPYAVRCSANGFFCYASVIAGLIFCMSAYGCIKLPPVCGKKYNFFNPHF